MKENTERPEESTKDGEQLEHIAVDSIEELKKAIEEAKRKGQRVYVNGREIPGLYPEDPEEGYAEFKRYEADLLEFDTEGQIGLMFNKVGCLMPIICPVIGIWRALTSNVPDDLSLTEYIINFVGLGLLAGGVMLVLCAMAGKVLIDNVRQREGLDWQEEDWQRRIKNRRLSEFLKNRRRR